MCAIAAAATAQSHQLEPGFSISEYRECLRMNSNFADVGVDSIYLAPPPELYKRIYTAPVAGFDNVWEMWQNADSTIAISIRGSVMTAKSWMSNFHAGMVAAQGRCTVGEEYAYNLCPDPRAGVHAGWLGAMLAMSQGIESRIDSCYALGYRNILLTGHSQGGAICFLLTAHLRMRQQCGALPADIQFKTYCSAAPKPGDYTFALHYEYLTRGGWAFNVVNAEDWVPETPLSVQQTSDFRSTNPFNRVDSLTASLGAIDRIKVNFLYSRLSKPTARSEKNLRKYLGRTLGKMLQAEAPEYQLPQFIECANYMRTGTTVVLMPDDQYYATHPRNAADAFEHHMFKAYHELAMRYK